VSPDDPPVFESLLFPRSADRPAEEVSGDPAFFADLGLDQVVSSLCAGRQQYDLAPFFRTPLHDVAAIRFRQQVMRDLEGRRLREKIRAFAERMTVVRRYLRMIEKLQYRHHRTGWFLEAVRAYCAAVRRLVRDLESADLESRGLRHMRDYLGAYTASGAFTRLEAQSDELKSDLGDVNYCILVRGSHVRVRRYAGEPDYSAEVARTFDKFNHGAAKDYTVKLPPAAGMNPVEARILDCVARLYPELFSRLYEYYRDNAGFADETVVRFDREVQFYLAFLEYIAPLRKAGLAFCYPEVTRRRAPLHVHDGFDLALARKCVAQKATVVCNDLTLDEGERVLVVTGPNQGGKTTFARMFGQLHYLAALGCPVPGRRARLFLFDRIFTHFEREERIQDLRGKLQDDLIRIHHILHRATPDSILILNEIFTSTSLRDALFLSRRVMDEIRRMDLLCVWVTFVDELASGGEKTVSMVSTVVPGHPELRTYRIVRKPADGLAYAVAIAEKYGLTYERLKERIGP